MDLIVSSPTLSVRIDHDTGRLVAARNLVRDLDLIAAPATKPPFRIELDQIGWVDAFTSFTHEPIKDGLRWQTEHNITLSGDVVARGDDILFTIAAQNAGRATVDRIEYPIFANIGRLGWPGQDELLHSHATGMLFRDPLDLFEDDPANRRRLRFSVYPEGFAGSTMQMLAYYRVDAAASSSERRIAPRR